MPDTLSLSTGVSLGLLAGIVSGVCYLVANGLSWPRDEESPKNTKNNSLTYTAKHRLCVQCGGQPEGGIVPCICHHYKPVKFESGAWFLRQVQRAISLMPWSISTDKLEQIEEECEPSSGTSDNSNGELHSIREFLELLSAKLAGGPLEGTKVAPIYDHPAYLPPAQSAPGACAGANAVGHTSGGASGAHAQLKRLVARVVEEAAALPALARYAAAPSPTPTIESSTYEDLLATAILNKVIERYQTENGSGGRSSGIHSASASPSPSDRSSPRSLNSRNAREVSPQLRDDDDVSDWEEGEAIEDAVELPRRVPFPEFGGDIVHQDNEDRDFDEISSSDIQAVDGSWEENWLFQKKKIKTIQSVPVPMLVPNSNTEYRALIGDRDAEDTTDLSDNASDAEEQTSDFKSNIKNVLDSKHVIGGKAKVDELLVDDFEPDSLMILDEDVEIDKSYNESKVNENDCNTSNIDIENNEEKSVKDIDNEDRKDSILLLDVESGPPPKAEFNLNEEIHRSIFNGNQVGQLIDLNASETMAEDSLDGIDHVTNSTSCADGTTNTLSRHERVGEYEETVTVPVQRYADSLRRQHYDTEDKECPLVENDKGEDLIPGTIAYRERKKWLNYVEMPNNPYSPEAIQKRLSAKSASSLFDSLTSKSKDFEVPSQKSHSNGTMKEEEVEIFEKKHNGSVNGDINDKMYLLDMNVNEPDIDDNKDKVPSPKTLKHVLSEEIPQYKRYGRDYYIKEAKTSSGARKASSLSDSSSVSSMRKSTSLDNIDTEFASPGLLIKQFTTIASNQHYTKFASKDEMQISVTTTPNNKDEILIEYEDANEHTLFAAKPALADDSTDEKFEEILQSAYNTNTAPLTIEIVNYSVGSDKPYNNFSTENSFISSSSLEDSIKIYNVQTGEIVKCKPEDKVSPRYAAADDKDIEVVDKDLAADTNDRLTLNGDLSEETVKINDNIKEDNFYKISEIEDILPQLPKVKELAKKFVSMENLNEPIKPSQQYLWRRKSKDNILNTDDKTDKPFNKLIYMHSLTARSISKEFRDELKLSMATPLTVPGGSKEFPEGIEEILKESSRPGSPVPEPGTIKTKLAFFESLKSKFSNK